MDKRKLAEWHGVAARNSIAAVKRYSKQGLAYNAARNAARAFHSARLAAREALDILGRQ